MTTKFTLTTLLIGLFVHFTGNAKAQLYINSVKKVSNTTLHDATLRADDHFGNRLRNIGDLDKDGVDDIAVSASDNADGGSLRGAMYIVFMNNDGTVKKYQKISQTQGNLGVTFPHDNYKFGYSITSVGDLDGDHVIDLAVGAVAAYGYQGTVWILYMKTDGTVKAAKELTGLPVNGGDILGCDITTVGDINNDGVLDIAVGAYGRNSGGSVFLVMLNNNGTIKSYKEISNGLNGFNANVRSGDLFGVSVEGCGDWDGDGNMDLMVGASGTDVSYSNDGALYILYLTNSGQVKSYKQLNNTQNHFGALSNSSAFGVSITALPDMDEDGYKEILVGSHSESDLGYMRGDVYILFMDNNSDIKSYQKIGSRTQELTNRLDDQDFFGQATSSIILNDNVLNLVVGAPLDDDVSNNAGALYLIEIGGKDTVKKQDSVGNSAISKGSISVSPNPCTTYLSIMTNGNTGHIGHIYIMDNTGNIVKEINDVPINNGKITLQNPLENVGIGLFYIQLVSDNFISTTKVSKY